MRFGFPERVAGAGMIEWNERVVWSQMLGTRKLHKMSR